MTPYGQTCQYNNSNDGKGKFRAALAAIYARGMQAQANGGGANPYPGHTQKGKAWQSGFEAGKELQAAIAESRAAMRKERP